MIEDILAQADAAIDAEGEKPEEKEEDPVASLLKQADEQITAEEKPKPKKVLVPGMDMPMGIGTPMQEEQVQEAEDVAPKPEIKELNDPVDILLQMSQGNYEDPKIYQWRDTLNQEQLAKLAERDPAFPLTDSQDRMAYDYLRKQSPFKIPRTFYDWYGIAEYTAGMVPKIAEPIAQSAVGFAKGAYKFGKGLAEYATAENFAWKDAYEKLPDDSKERVRERLGSIPGGFFNPKALPDAEIAKIVFSEVPEEERKQYQKRVEEGTEAGRTAVYSALEPIVGLPISMAETATKIGTGGISAWDRLTESIGLRTYDDSFENWRNRRLFDSAMQQWNTTRPNSYAKALEVMSPAIVAIAKADGPTVEDYMREEGLTREQAELARDYDAEQWTLDSINKVQQEDIPAIDEDIRTFGEFALPAGFGLDQFGYAMNLARVGSWATPRLYAKLRLAGMTPEQVNKYYSDRINAAEKWAEDKFKRRTKQGVVERAAGAADDQIRRMQAAMDQSAFWKRVRQAAPYVAGGAVGYGVTEDPLAVLYGPLAGRLAVSFPGFIRDWQEARRLSAGGRQGQFATLAEIRQDRANNAIGARKFDPEAPPPVRLRGSISERIQDFGGEKLDNIVDNIREYVHMGVEPTILGIGVGAINSSDDEELASTIGMGLLYSLGGRGLQQVQTKLFGGVDPVIERRKLNQDMNDLQKVYRDATPETKQNINFLSDWNRVIDAKAAELGNALNDLNKAEASGNADQIEAAKKKVELRTATLERVKRANIQTRNEYSRQWLRNIARVNILGNGTLREGMNNVGIHILDTDQIFKKLRENPANSNVSDETLRQAAEQSGFYSPTGGVAVFKPGSGMNLADTTFIFDTAKPSVVINSDAIRTQIRDRGELPVAVINHEFGHHLKNVPEYAELIKDAEAMLFSQEVKDLSGKTVATTSGQYNVEDLLDIYWNRYLSGYTNAEKRDFARMNGLWDENTGRLKRDETAAYMRNEIMADLGSETVSRYIDPQKDGAIKEIYDRALLKFRTKKLARFVDQLRRAGGTGDVITDVTMTELSPDVLRLGIDALKAYDALKNQVSPSVAPAERPKISRAQIMQNRALQARYGSDSPLFSTSIKAQVFDSTGNPVGESIPVSMANTSLSEGVWEVTDTGIKQLSGYGQISPQVDTSKLPVGSRIVISNQLDYQPDGKTPIILNPREAKKRGRDRGQLIRAALDNTPDYGAPNRFQPVAPGSDTYRGTFSPMQLQALQNIPESILPKSIKEKMIAINAALARNDGTRMIVDYAPVMTDSGKYQAFSPKIYDVVPIGMMFSKDGNFLATTISVTRLFDKLNAWSERMPARLSFWNGSKDRFWKDFETKYLANWQNGITGSGYDKTGKLIDGANPLDADPEIAEQKKNIFNDFLNLFDKEGEALNIDRTVTPRRRGDAKDKNIDRTIMSMRIDHIAEIMENPMGKLPIVYGYAKANFMPKAPEAMAAVEAVPVAPSGTVQERGFFSRLQRAIDEKVQGRSATAQQMRAIIENPQSGIKADEIKWTGVLDEIDRIAQENNGQVPKEQVLRYLQNEGQVNFTERVYSNRYDYGTRVPYEDLKRSTEISDATSNYIDKSKSPSMQGLKEELSSKYGPDAYNEGIALSLRKTPRTQEELFESYNEISAEVAKAEQSGDADRAARLKVRSELVKDMYDYAVKNNITYAGYPDYKDLQTPEGNRYRESVMTVNPSPSSEAVAIAAKYGLEYGEATGKKLLERGVPEAEIMRFQGLVNQASYPRVESFIRTHYSGVPNYIAHMRYNERRDAKGKVGLFSEEFQSDRHQKGREEGYLEDLSPEGMTARVNPLMPESWEVFDKDGKFFRMVARNDMTPNADAAVKLAIKQQKVNAIPDAPFRKDWGVQLFKRLLREAVDSKANWVGWTAGVEQVRRYETDIRQKIDEIKYTEDDGGMVTLDFMRDRELVGSVKASKQSGNVRMDPGFSGQFANAKLQDVVGDAIAKKIMGSTGDGVINGDDLTIGGEGMKKFYDDILVKDVKKYVSKMGGTVIKDEMPIFGWYRDKDGNWRESDDANDYTEIPYWKVEITPQMRETVSTVGQPQFMPKVAVVPERFTGRPESERRGQYKEPSPFFRSFGIDEFTKGGKFFDAETKEDITDRRYQSAEINVSGTRPSMTADVPSTEKGSGNTYKSNLFRKSAGWEWISYQPPEVATVGNDPVLVSVEGGSRHVYGLKANYEGGVQLERYPDKKSEPRLRPTGKGTLVLGNEVGRIKIRGKEHPVYDQITVAVPKGKALEDVAPIDVARTEAEPALAEVAPPVRFVGQEGTPLQGLTLEYVPEAKPLTGINLAPRKKDRTDLRVRMTRQALTDAALSQKEWRDWYKEHKEVLDDFFGDYAPLFQEILSVTSQAASVKANVGLALKAFGQMMRGEQFDGYLPAVIGNLNAIRNKAAIGGRKIGKYKSANEGDTAAVVVDRHIASLLFGTKSPTAAQFEKATKILTEIANDIGWEPAQVQAALWAYSIVKSGKEPQSYGSYLKQLEARGDVLRRIGLQLGAGIGGELAPPRTGRGRYSPTGEAEGERVAVQFSPIQKTKSFVSQVDETPDVKNAPGYKLPSKVPSRGYFNVEMEPTDPNDRKIIYKVDPKNVVTPKVADPLVELDGETIVMGESDPHDALGDRMAGLLYPYLRSNQVIATTSDGRQFKPGWANLGLGMVTRAQTAVAASTNGYYLPSFMKEFAHKSNRDFVTRLSKDIDKIKKNLTPTQLNGLHAIFELGALDPKSRLAKMRTKHKKMVAEENPKADDFLAEIKNKEKEWQPYIEFLEKYFDVRKILNTKKPENFDQKFDDLINEYSQVDWFKNLIAKYSKLNFADEAAMWAFTERGAAMDAAHKLPFIPSIIQRLDNEGDFRGAKNTDLMGAVQLSKDPDAFKVYVGQKKTIPKNAPSFVKKFWENFNADVDRNMAAMTPTELDIREQFMSNPAFRPHPSYDWIMLSPANANNFLFDKAIDPLKLFPEYAQSHPKKTVQEGSRETVVGTMKKSGPEIKGWKGVDRPLTIRADKAIK